MPEGSPVPLPTAVPLACATGVSRPAPSPLRMLTELAPVLATARSTLPSPSKSPASATVVRPPPEVVTLML